MYDNMQIENMCHFLNKPFRAGLVDEPEYHKPAITCAVFTCLP